MTNNSKPPAPPGDEWTQRLRATMLKDRSRFRRHLGILLALVVLAVLVVVGFIYRQTSLPPLAIVAFDNLCLPDEEATVRACVEAIEGDPLPGYLGGLEVVFDDPAGSQPVKAKTQGPGQASASLPLSVREEPASFLARLPGTRRVSASEDLARVVFLARGTKIVLVDVHDLLADPATEFAGSDVNRIVANPERAKLLREEKRQVVYLALKDERALGYRTARRWIESQRQILPRGPVLGRPIYHEPQTEDDARRQIISSLSSRYDVESKKW